MSSKEGSYQDTAERCSSYKELTRSFYNTLEIFVVLITVCNKIMCVARVTERCSWTTSDIGKDMKKGSMKELSQFEYVIRELCEEKRMQVKLSCECSRLNLILEKKCKKFEFE